MGFLLLLLFGHGNTYSNPVYGRQSRECQCGFKTNLGDEFQDKLDCLVRLSLKTGLFYT